MTLGPGADLMKLDKLERLTEYFFNVLIFCHKNRSTHFLQNALRSNLKRIVLHFINSEAQNHFLLILTFFNFRTSD
jgi:hypothetical protein